jgi:hypothetical protein
MIRHIITTQLTQEQGQAYFASPQRKPGSYLTYHGGAEKPETARLQVEFNRKADADRLKKLLCSLKAKPRHKVLQTKQILAILEEIVAQAAAEFPEINPTVLLTQSCEEIHHWIKAGNMAPKKKSPLGQVNKPVPHKTINLTDKLIERLKKRRILKETPTGHLKLHPRNKKLRKIWEENKNLRQQNIILAAARKREKEIAEILEKCGPQNPDMFYRFYHHSLKAYWIQDKTKSMMKILTEVGQEANITEWNQDFLAILKRGQGKTFKFSHNRKWRQHARPLLEAFFHTREMLACLHLATKEVTQGTNSLPSGWAAVLYLYGIR